MAVSYTHLDVYKRQVEALGFENGKEIILYRRGTYRWNHDLDITVDTEQFESLCEAAARPGPDRLGHMLAAAALYRGDFLPKDVYKRQPPCSWVLPPKW